MYQKEFLHLLSLPLASDKKIQLFKRSCFKHIGRYMSMNARGHISFAKFIDDVDEQTGVPKLLDSYHEIYQQIFLRVPPPVIKLQGFGYFEHGPNYRTIYAAIVMDEKTTTWFDFVKQVFSIGNDFNPHVTIARRISTANFNKLWPFFERIQFEDSFQIDFLTVLAKKANHKELNYQLYKQILFAGQYSA